MLTADAIDLVAEQFSDATEVQFPKGKKATISVELPSGSQTVVGLKITLPQKAARGAVLKTHFLQRHVKTRRITGGIAAEIRVV